MGDGGGGEGQMRFFGTRTVVLVQVHYTGDELSNADSSYCLFQITGLVYNRLRVDIKLACLFEGTLYRPCF